MEQPIDGTQNLIKILTEQRNTACDHWAETAAAALTLRQECDRLSAELKMAQEHVAALTTKGSNGDGPKQPSAGPDPALVCDEPEFIDPAVVALWKSTVYGRSDPVGPNNA